MTILLKALTKVQGDLVEGAEVRVQGILNEGVLLATHLRAKRDKAHRQRSSRVKIKGLIDHIVRDEQGRVTAVTVDGVPVALEGLDRMKHALELGRLVEIQGAIRLGRLVANKLENEESKPEKELVVQFTHRGVVDSVNRDDQGHIVSLEIDGRKLAVRPLTRVKGEIAEGQAVLVRGLFRNGRYLARTLTAIKGSDRAKTRKDHRSRVLDREINIDELVDSVERDAHGRIIRIVVNGMDVSASDLAKTNIGTPGEDCRSLLELTCLKRTLEEKPLKNRTEATIRADETRVLMVRRQEEARREQEARTVAKTRDADGKRLAKAEQEAKTKRLAKEKREAEEKR